MSCEYHRVWRLGLGQARRSTRRIYSLYRKAIPVRAVRRLILPVVMAGALITAACSSSTTGTSSTATGSGTSSGQSSATGSPVKVAFLGTISGPTGSNGATVAQVVQAWGRYINDHGGLAGHPVEIEVHDTAGATGASIPIAKAVVAEKVAAIFDLDATDYQWVKMAEAAGIPVISNSTASQQLSKDVFPTAASNAVQQYLFSAAAKTLGTKTAIGYAAETPVAAQYAASIKSIATQQGVSVVVSAKLSSSQPDYTAFCQLLKSSGAQSSLLALSTATVQKVADQCWQQGAHIPQVQSGFQFLNSWLKDPAFNGAIMVDQSAPFFDSSIPGIAAYRAAMKTYLPSLLGSTNDSSAGVAGWAYGEMLAYGVSHGGGVTSADIIKGLHTAKDETLDSLIAPMTFTAGDFAKGYCEFFWAVKNGGYALTSSGTKPVCAPKSVIDPMEAAVAKSFGS